MEYVQKGKDDVRFYSVTYDKEKLKEILRKLENYGYAKIANCRVGGHITRWPATKKTIRNRVIDRFNERMERGTARLLPETIEHHIEDNDCQYVTYDYKYVKLPDLYDYVDLIANDGHIMGYTRLFGRITKERTGSLNMFYAAAHRDQLILEGIINYINSPELTDHNPLPEEKEYDYKGLNELYKEVLGCFNFKLIAIKEFLKEPEPVNVRTLQPKNNK